MGKPVTNSRPPAGRVRAYILRMSGLSTTAMKVLRTCNEPNTCANHLNRAISLDPVLTGRVLQLVNSAYYSLPSKVNSLTRAIILLGINAVKNVVLSFAIFETFSRHDSFRVFSADEFWTHSLSTAAAAKILATREGVPLSEREDFFVAGLMHDIGKIPLNHLFPDAYQEAAQLALGSGQGMRHAEDALLGMDHCRVGLMIARKWQLSSALTDALGRHHGAGDPKSNGGRLTNVVAMADAVAHDMGATIPGGVSLDEQGPDGLNAPGKLTPNALADLTVAVADEVEKAKVFLEIAARR